MAKRIKRKYKVGTSKKRKQKKYLDRLITEIYTGKPCEICGTTYQTCGHHAAHKSLSVYYRHVPENIVVLCPTHHKFGNDIAAHSKNILAVDKFLEWLKDNRPDAYHCIETYKLCHKKDVKLEQRIEVLEALKEK